MTTGTKVPAVQAYVELLRDLDDEELAEELRFIRRLLQSAYEEVHDRSKGGKRAAGTRRMEERLNAERGARVIEWSRRGIHERGAGQ